MKIRLTTLILAFSVFISISGILGCSNSSEKDAAKNEDVQKASSAETTVAQLPKMLDLGSGHCIPCKKMAPILDSLKIAYQGKADIVFIDVNKDKQSSRKYGITLIPTQIFFNAEGKEVYRHIGFFPADSIVAHLESLGVSL
jgi:thioredoxin 1